MKTYSRIFAPLLCGLALLLCPAPVRAQISFLDVPSPIQYGTTLNPATFTVSTGASVLVVFYGGRTQGDSPGSDPGVPVLAWNGLTLTKAVSQGSTASTWDDNAIYYLINPPAGTGAITTGALPTGVNQTWWMAYTLVGVNTSAPLLTGSVGNSSAGTVNNTVNNIAAGDWAAVATSASNTGETLAVTTTPTGGTAENTTYGTSGNTTQTMGAISNCPGGNVEFISTGSTTGAKMVLVEAIFSPPPPPLPPAPTLTVATASPAQVDLSWTEAANSHTANFIVLRSTNSSGPFTDYTNVLGAGVTNYTDANVVSGRTYYYTVGAANITGTNYSATNSATPTGSPFPPLLGVGASGAGNVTLHWTTSFGATNYIVLRATTSGAETQIKTVTNNTYTDTGLTSGTTYYYEVEAAGAGGTSGPSDEASAVALASGWHLFDNFSLDTVNTALNGQTGSAGLGTGWVNLGGGSPITVTNSSAFGGANYAQYAEGAASGIGDYESGLGIAGTNTHSTVFFEFSLPGIIAGVSNVEQLTTNIVAMNFDIDNSTPPGYLTGQETTGPSAQFNYDNSSGDGYFRVLGGNTFYFATISPMATPYVPIPGDIYYFWFVLNAANGTFQVYLANASEEGTNTDSGGLGSTPTLMWGATSTTGTGTIFTYGFRNVTLGAAVGQPVNIIGTGPGSALGTVPQNEFANIYVDQTTQNLTNPVTGAAPTGAQILLQPQPLQLFAGETAVFNIVTSAGVSYQWQSNGVNLTNVGNVSGVTSSTLVISNVTLATEANYVCVVQNTASHTFASSVPASLTIVTPNGAFETAVAAAGASHLYAFNDTGNPQSGTEIAYDFAGSDDGLYGANALNGFDNIYGPNITNGFPGFPASNYAVQLAGLTEPNNVTLDSSWNLDTNEVTITAWINPSTPNEVASTAIVLNRGGGNDVEGLIINTSGNFTLGYDWNNDANTTGWDSGLLPPAGQWSLVALTVTPNMATISMMNTNGVFSSTHVYPHVVAPFTGITMIGDDPGSPTGTLTFNGIIDEVGVFNQALSQAALQSMFTAASGLSIFPPTNTVAPAMTTTYPGQSVAFSSVDEGSAPMSFIWQINTTNLTDGASAIGFISGSDTANLSITNLAAGDEGQTYNVTLVTSNAFGVYTSAVPAVLMVSPTFAAENITMSTFEAAGDWNSTGVWNDNAGGQPASVDVIEFPGSTFEILPGAQLRTPVAVIPYTNFPGVQLTVDGNGVFINNPAAASPVGQIKFKQGESGETNYFPLLVMAGGQLDNANAGTAVIAGVLNIVSNTPIYVDNAGAEDRPFQITALLEGNGSIYYQDYDNSLTGCLDVTGNSNTFTGTWNIALGPLVGGGTNSLGTNSITIAEGAALETLYPLNNPKSSLYLDGQLFLTQNDTFGNVVVAGAYLSPGVYSYTTLSALYPANFPLTFIALLGASNTTAAGSVTVLGLPPVINSQPPARAEEFVGAHITYSIAAGGIPGTSFQWYVNGVLISGATGSAYTFVAAASNTYYCVVSNSVGTVTNMVDTNTATTPPLQVTFNDTNNWTLQGTGVTPTLDSGVLQLTDNNGSEAASAFYDIAQYIEGFTTSFTYTPSGALGADGVTFCVQNSAAGPASLGDAGGDLGFTGITNSAAFELNIYALANGGVGIGFDTDGNITPAYGAVTNSVQATPLNLASGDPINVNLYYSQGILQATLLDTVTSVSYVTNFDIGDLGAVVGDSVGYIGFTGGDGGETSIQQISNFAFLPAATPVLSISKSGGGNATISWSGGVLTSYVLQESSSLSGPWSNVSATPTLVGSQYQVVVTPGAGPQYYRLQMQ